MRLHRPGAKSPLVLPQPDTLERDLKPGEGAGPEGHNAVQRSACLKLPASDHVAEDSDKAGGEWCPGCSKCQYTHVAFLRDFGIRGVERRSRPKPPAQAFIRL